MQRKKIRKRVLKIIACAVIILVVYEVIGVIRFAFEDYGKPYYEITLEEIPIDMSQVTENLSIRDLKEMNGDDLVVNYDYSNSETPRNIIGVFTTRKILTPEDALYALMSVRGIMKIEETSFACTNVVDWGVKKIFYFQQLYKGIPVEGGDLGVSATGEGEPLSASGYYMPVKEIDVTPRFSIEEALESVNLEKGTRVDNYQLVISQDHLVWKVTVVGWGFRRGDRDAFKIVYVDASTGSVLWAIRD